VLELSLRESLQLGLGFIGTEHVLLGVIREGAGVAVQILGRLGVRLYDVRNTVIALLAPGVSLVLASQDDLLFREQEVDRAVRILMLRNRNCPVLVGPSGVGKSALLTWLATRGETLLPGVRFTPLPPAQRSVDGIAKLVADANVGGPVLLLADDLMSPVYEQSGTRPLMALLTPLINDGLRIVGTVTPTERGELVADTAFARLVQLVHLAPLTVDQTRSVLATRKPTYTSHHGADIRNDVLAVIPGFADTAERALPGSAVDLLDAVLAHAVLSRTRLTSRYSHQDLNHVVEATEDDLRAVLDSRDNVTEPTAAEPISLGSPQAPAAKPFPDNDPSIWSLS
jgi:ATP-dependent Clp protease ATP-binding subunit ClpC